MIRNRALEARFGEERGFHWRGGEVSRLEGFSDAVFAFAVTLLVVSLEVPDTFAKLLVVMRGFAAFGLCFAWLAYVWNRHYAFFRRYGLGDPLTVNLNVALLFVVLFYVYPLKFLATVVIDQLTGARIPAEVIGEADRPSLFAIYGAGYLAVNLVFALLYSHALRLRTALRLSPIEAHVTRENIQYHLIHCAVALASILLAGLSALGPAVASDWAWGVYLVIGPLMTWHYTVAGRRRRRLEEAEARPEPGVSAG